MREVRDEVVVLMRDEYVRLDYSKAKLISDINIRLEEITQLLQKIKATDEDKIN